MSALGILTAGGVAPGVNAAIAEVFWQDMHRGRETIGFRDGFKGLYESTYRLLAEEEVMEKFDQPGSMLGCTGFDPWMNADAASRIINNYKELNLEGLVVIGGDTSIRLARRLHAECAVHGVRIAFIPKTVDNDISGIKYAIGFWSAVEHVREYVRGLQSSAEAEHRIYIVETMGRDTGWLALYGGSTSGADIILIPEVPFRIEKLLELLRERRRQDRATMVVVAEGLKDFFLKLVHTRHPLICALEQSTQESILSVEKESQEQTDQFGQIRWEGFASKILLGLVRHHVTESVRADVVGHIQKAGVVSGYDVYLGRKLANCAVHLLLDEKRGGIFITNDTIRGARGIALAHALGLRHVPAYEWRGVPGVELIRSHNGNGNGYH